MKNKNGLELQEATDINIDGCPTMMKSMEEMHDEALEINYSVTRMSEDVAIVDAQEMINYRKMSQDEAWDAWKAEEARKAHQSTYGCNGPRQGGIMKKKNWFVCPHCGEGGRACKQGPKYKSGTTRLWTCKNKECGKSETEHEKA